MSRRLNRSMSMNDASRPTPGGGPRSSGATQEFKALQKTPVFREADPKSKTIGALAAGTVVLALDTRMDKKGRSFYRRGRIHSPHM